MALVRVGKRGIVVLPVEIRKRIGLSEGDELIVEVDNYGGVHMMKRPGDYAAFMRNLGKEVWRGADPAEYVRKERESWER